LKIPGWRWLAAVTVLGAPMLVAQTPPNWTLQSPASVPPAREGHAMAYDSSHSQTVMFGGQGTITVGQGQSPYMNDTWLWDGSNWTKASPQSIPAARAAHAMAYDANHNQTVLYGGVADSQSGFANDTWVWNGTNWAMEATQNRPQERYGHAMVYDSVRKQVVMFGGDLGIVLNISPFLNDTWFWDGSNWTQQSPQTSPPARAGHGMAFDSAHGQTVLFGGEGTTGINSSLQTIALNDTWLWDGANWTQQSPVNSPSARSAFSMAFDSVHGQVVLFGGLDNNGTNLDDTWIWDGSNWTQVFPQASPSARNSFALSYDSNHDQVVLFGGAPASFQPVSDTWTWIGAALPAGPSVSAVVSASAFGGFTSVAPGSWIEIYGSNLAPGTQGWTGADFAGDNAPTSLDGVEVMVGGQKAFVDYVSPAQVNAQLPSNIATGGTLQLTVSNGSATSGPVNVTVNPTEPGLLAPLNFKIGANQYVVAILPDGNYVLPAGSIAGVTSRPAKPGETVVMYGVGFGSVTPNIPAGEIATGANELTAPLKIMFGSTPAQSPLAYFGLAPSAVGLYQFNVVVPTVADSNLIPLTFTLGGTAGTQTLYTAVSQ
jgi:uncharacterized protein (TIGR03437 family)